VDLQPRLRATYKLTMQVVKNIIPAVASTNAIIAAACVNEAVKAVTRSSMLLNNYMQYNGVRLTGCELHEYGKQPNCTVCQIPRLFEMKAADTLGALRERVAKELEIEGPDLSTSKAMLYQGVAHDSWAANLDKPLSALFPSGSLISVEGKQRRSAVVLVTY
jgi:NEDD8-activating enzyme E1